ncbi:ABC transporter G family member 20-like [Bacillus rossius redtenbacheri]|uniref:ABC transporter G family member 20-like n=1 Tax=Bacillus rossius redtenbacheri TaxID=93214 RepID=UPI002FDE8AAE
MAAGERCAVRVRGARLQYGRTRVLQGLDMSVLQGTIYGLLGASGCGKTTLLSCVVGRRRLCSGEVEVLGVTPGTVGSGVPGRRIGYMPQETALYKTFTVMETLRYFGWIFGMKPQEFVKRAEMLLDLLEMPDKHKLVQFLSGGQKRRLSFAAALLHDSEVLILDEPTVGLDPVLRDVIWQYLLRLVGHGGKTVILTTHYIEEARQAHTVGLMRNGRLMDEDSPNNLLNKYGCDSLEDVFLQLSVRQERRTDVQIVPDEGCHDESGQQDAGKSIAPSERTQFIDKQLALVTHHDAGDNHVEEFCNLMSVDRMKALLFKNYISVFRDPVYVSFIFGLCVFAVTCVWVGFGGTPRGLRLAVVNHDSRGAGARRCEGSRPLAACNLTDLGCRFIAHLAADTFYKDFYDSRESAAEAVRRGRAWGSLYFSENFTSEVADRVMSAHSITSHRDVPDSSNVQVRLDMSNKVIGWMIWEELHATYMRFADSILSSCDKNVRIARVPLSFKEPVYGSMTPSFLTFAAPGVLNMMMYFFGVALTVWGIAAEREEGLLNRNIVAGVTSFEIMFSYFLTQFVLMCCQAALLIGFGIFVYDFHCAGSLLLVVCLILLQGISGMCYGFVISASCQTERTAIHIAVGSLVPMMILCCVVWPAEGMYGVLRAISPFVPMTLPVHSMRAVMLRGWGMEHFDVYAGFLGSSAWILVLAAACALIFRVHKL